MSHQIQSVLWAAAGLIVPASKLVARWRADRREGETRGRRAR